jgi:hypothetical protein
MKISHILEGVRMGASDLRKAPKKEYTIGFEFEIKIDDKYENEIDQLDDFDDPSSQIEKAFSDFIESWDGFDFENWFNLRSSRDNIAILSEIEPLFGRPSTKEIISFLKSNETEVALANIEGYTDDQIDLAKKCLTYLHKNSGNPLKNKEAIKQTLAFYYIDMTNHDDIISVDDNDDSEFKSHKDVYDMVDMKYLSGEITTDATIRRDIRHAHYRFSTFFPKPINAETIDKDNYVYASHDKVAIVAVNKTATTVEDIISLFDTTIDELKQMTEDEWQDVANEQGSEAFDDWYSEQTRRTFNPINKIDYVKSIIKKEFGSVSMLSNKRTWAVVLDSSVQDGVEVISPVMNIGTGLTVLRKMLNIIKNNEHMSTYYSTGLHINIGTWKDREYHSIDLLKFLTIFNGAFAAKQFNRDNNENTEDSLEKLIRSLRSSNAREFAQSKDEINSRIINTASKFQAVNLSKLRQHGYIELRAVGNKNYETKEKEILIQINRLVRALEVASNPDMLRKEYISTLSAAINKHRMPENIEFMDVVLQTYFAKFGVRKKHFRAALMDLISNGFDVTAEQLDKNYTLAVHRSIAVKLDELQEHGPAMLLTDIYHELYTKEIDTKKYVDNRAEIAKSKLFRNILRRYKGNIQ